MVLSSLATKNKSKKSAILPHVRNSCAALLARSDDLCSIGAGAALHNRQLKTSHPYYGGTCQSASHQTLPMTDLYYTATSAWIQQDFTAKSILFTGSGGNNNNAFQEVAEVVGSGRRSICSKLLEEQNKNNPTSTFRE